MKKLGLSILLILMTACGIDELDEARYETFFILKKLTIENDEVTCVKNSSGTSNFNCIIHKKEEVIGTSECHYHYCSISLR